MFKSVEPKPDFPKLEEEILKFWEEDETFKKSLEKTKSGKPFTFYDGPPFATGLPHYGHILASTIKDVIPRYQTMKGRFVRRRWGWDCHGLPIEELVERKLGISGKKEIEKIGIKKFNETCRSMVLEYVDEWGKMVRRIARWIEFDNSYKTMDRDYMESVWWAFKQIYDKGLVYEGRKVLMYCPRCETPVSNFEVAMDNSYKDVTEEAVTVKFRIKNKELRIKDSTFHIPNSTFILAWTTTPWTLPGNVALAVGPDIDYVLVEKDREGFILAKELLGSVFASEAKQSPQVIAASPSAPRNDVKIVSEFKGKELIGLSYEPLYEVSGIATLPSSPPHEGGTGGVFKVYAADFVTTDEGTGVVHTAVVYGEDDYKLGLAEHLPVVPMLDEKGKFNDKSPKLIRGAYFKDAEKVIKKDLESRGLLFDRKQYQHSYPHCWRCSTPLYYNAIPSWFINIQKIKGGLVKSNKREINWYPGHLKHGRYEKSVEAAPDWNISRNRYWGNPIPIWRCTNAECKHDNVVGKISELGLNRNHFYFTRHGEADHNVLGINSAFPEKKKINLTKAGVVRAKALEDKLEKMGGIDLIVSSPVLRTKETSRIIAEKLDVPVEIDERLQEINTGIYDGKKKADFDKEYPMRRRWNEAPEGGETNQGVERRMLEAIQDINKKNHGKDILIVTHGDPLWILQQYFGSERPYPKYADVFELDVSIVDLHRPYIDEVVLKCAKCGSDARRITEIFDSWVEAGSMPFAEYHYPFDQKETFEARFPAQFVAEYIAQTRAWFYVMHVISFVLLGKAPFENVVTTGNILAEDGSKMSKSKNNFPDPWLTINKYGVDTLRFNLMNSIVMQGDDINFQLKDLENDYRKIVMLLWNVYNYFVTYANESSWETGPEGFTGNPESVMDQWIVAKTQELVNEVTKHLDGYDTVKATRIIEQYVNDLSTWYLRRSRGRKDDNFFLTLGHSLLTISKVLAPFAPYISEEIFRNLNRKNEVSSVHLSDWPMSKTLTADQLKVLKTMDLVREAASVGLAARKQVKLTVKQPLLRLAVESKLAGVQFTSELLEILLSELNVKSVDARLVDEAKINNKIYGFPGTKHIQYFYLDTAITEELRIEGFARNLERFVQEMRKKAGFKVGEIAILSYNTNDKDLSSAMQIFDKNKAYIGEIRANQGQVLLSGEYEIEGKKIWLGLASK